LYEQIVTAVLEGQLKALGPDVVPIRGRLDPEEAPDRIALHLGTLIRRAISGLDAKQRAEVGIKLARQVGELLIDAGRGVDAGDLPVAAGDILRAIVGRLPDGSPAELALPATPLLDTTLLTNAPGEPRLGFQLVSEVPSSDRIDVLMAFVRQTGIRPLMEVLRRHTDEGRTLRLLTTTYTGSTELAALEALIKAGAQVRVSYDTSTTRLHAKAWLFHRASGFSTAYIGSSNLTHSAQVTGMEWNVRVSGARNPDLIEKFGAIFESYWAGDEFRAFDSEEFKDLTQAPGGGPRIYLSPVELRPEPFQSRLLEQIELARLQGRHRNLLVSATGTGKTVMAALDYLRLRARLPRARLLFLAHRKEILDQSQATFRHALRDAAFGESWLGGERPTKFEHVFASIQSLTASGVRKIAPDHFDVVIIDEFHHAAAPTYEALLTHLEPRELLGLTATPERSDDQPILQWFDGRIAAELRLWDAIDQHRLCPFAYYGISDGIDYRNVTWRRGHGYDPTELSNLVTGDTVTARRIIANVLKTVTDPSAIRALGFCVSVAHARFMADQFNAAGLPSTAVWADSPTDQRQRALANLAAGVLKVVFSVDLFNEGVDIPSVDTLIFLRPTDSPTVFLQQLGRGLRREVGKSACTVLDFVGQHRKEFQLHRRYGALLGGSRKQLATQIEAGFPFLPSGCHMELDAVASKAVLDNIRESLPSTWRAKAQELQRVADGSKEISLKRFLDETGLALEDVYSNNHCWSDLLTAGSLPTAPAGPAEVPLRRALGRLLHIDDPLRINRYREWSGQWPSPNPEDLDLRDQRLLHMLLAVLIEAVANPGESLSEAVGLLWQHPQILAELGQLMEVLADRIDHVQSPLSTHPETPLLIHARYTRREILAAFSDGRTLKTPEWREGTRWIPSETVDLLAITLDKSSGHFSPTTRYRDYAVSRELLHWESQSTTRAESETGQRYRQHVERGTSVLPFARVSPDDRAFWLLGPAIYKSHEGERPISFVWQLAEPLPGDLFASFAAVTS
jgi:superfamily II DNA or RNA helicase/HKD family nuclease